MQIESTKIKGLLIFTPRVFTDNRGYFMETYNRLAWEEFINVDFVQDNESQSAKNVIRGLHFQKPPHAQDKLVRVVHGSVLDIAVDLRHKSPTYGEYVSVLLSAENKKQLFIPKGFAHGFVSLADQTILSYKCSNFYHPESDATILWNDKDLNINWNVTEPIISEKDAQGIEFGTFKSPF